jgi:hypothetical protein
MHQPRYLLFGVFFVLGTLAMFVPIHFATHEAFWDKLLDPSHMLFFGGVTWLLVVTNPLGIVGHRPRLIVAMTFATGLAAAVEILQPLTGRDQSMGDFREGTFGVMLVGAAMWTPLVRRSRAFVFGWSAAVIVLLIIGLQPAWMEARGLLWRAQHFPVLADFESDDEMRLWISSGLNAAPLMDTSMDRRTAHASHGGYSLIVLIGPGAWPGVRLLCDDQDWTGYSALSFDIYNDDPPFELALRIDDDDAQGGHDTRFNRALALRQGWNHFRIPLAEVERGPGARTLHMNAIRRVVFFRDHPKEWHTIYLDYLRLER